MSFTPPVGLANRHVQTIFSSIGPRRRRVRKHYDKFRQNEQKMILDCEGGVRLAGFYNQAQTSISQQLAILIHGWEGSAESSYMLSLTNCLLENGIDVFRLNLRDHGDTHHLNEGIFNSTLLPEVMSALENIQSTFDHQQTSLVGFSLGGNFALRVAGLAHDKKIKLERVIAFCPALHASRSNAVLSERANFIYEQYFVRKWRRSLLKKLEHYPDFGFGDELPTLRTLDEMNETLIPKYTDYDDVEEYFAAYSIIGDALQQTICPCYLHFAKDDMIIPYQDIELLADNPDLHVTLTERGGHCGFLMNWQLESWQDQRTLELLI